jgi:Protein of unknown function (DUF3631)
MAAAGRSGGTRGAARRDRGRRGIAPPARPAGRGRTGHRRDQSGRRPGQFPGQNHDGEFAELRRLAKRWAFDNFDKLTDPDPETPKQLNDRAADNWRPLLAIAELAGGDWPKLAREAACLLSGEVDTDAMGIELLKDIRAAFEDDDEIRSADLIAKLTADSVPKHDLRNGRLNQTARFLLKSGIARRQTVRRPPGR